MGFLVTKKIITGCEDRGDAESPYLTRWSFPRIGVYRGNLHLFHRSDADEMHDHPWPFVSVILWRGYVEETPCPLCKGEGFTQEYPYPWYRKICYDCRETGRVRRRVWPGMILFRKAEHIHRVELIEEKPALTFVVMGKRIREWGFWTPTGWESFKSYFTRRGC